MKSFSSSAINKSGKKFAPKVPVRRTAPTSSATPRRPSATSQTQAPQASQQEKDVVDTIPPSSALPTEPATPALSEESPITESVPSKQNSAAPKSATAIPTPRPKRKTSISKPTTQDSATVITPSTTQQVSPFPHPSTFEHQRAPSIEHEPELPALEDCVDIFTEFGIPPPVSSEPRGTPSAATEIRPKKTSETIIAKPFQKASNARAVPAPAITTPTPQPLVPSVEGPNETPGESAAPSTPKPGQAAPKAKKRKASKAGTSEADGENGKPKRARRRKREPTPEGAEMVAILPNVVKMSELCKDLKTGRKSRRETELRKMDLAEQERKQKAQDGRVSTERTPIKQNGDADSNQKDRLPDWTPQAGPVMRLVNGEIVLDTASLQVDRHADAARSAGDLEDVVENSLTRKINQASYGKRSKTESWDDEMTDLFYRGLRMFGTDFMVISKLFPGRSRHQIKLKFNNEERRDPQRIKEVLLGPREPIDIATYSEMTKTEYDDPRAIQQELDEEKQRIEEQHAQEKAMQEELLRNPHGSATDFKATSAGDKSGAAAKGKSGNNKKQTVKTMGRGTEEVLGSIDDVPTAT